MIDNSKRVLTELTDIVTFLPRGGYLVETTEGYIQFGSPPETIKDTIGLPLGVPQIFVLPYEFFNWIKGISVSELEFPLYYNFFIQGKKTKIICDENQARRLTEVLQESLFGPDEILADFADDGHDIKKEMDFFRTFEFTDVVEFCIFKNDTFSINDIDVEIDVSGNFNIREKGEFLAHVPGNIEYKPKYQIGERLHEPFNPPLFGLTCLGSSSGFDPQDNTSGFILWINHHGIMIDPPVNSTEWLLDSNVSPKFIDSIILTHCHADHDAGTFQKILEESKITIYATETIMQSFLKKYAALTDVSVDYLKKLFLFEPIKIGIPKFIHGARFDCLYALHSIPTVGFEVEFQSKRIVYSSDHQGDPELQKKLFDDGVITEKRYNELKNFSWDSDVILHESGMKPLHTPIDYLDSLPDDVKEKTIIYHIPESQMPKNSKLSRAQFGIENTIYFGAWEHPFEKTYQVLGLLKNLDFSQDMTIAQAQEFFTIAKEETFTKGDIIIKKGSPGYKFFIIQHGNVSVQSVDGKFKKIYGPHDYFGEAALMKNESRTADVIAETDVILYSIAKDQFLNFIEGTGYKEILNRLVQVRDDEVWETLSSSFFVRFLTSTQRTWFESMLSSLRINKEKDVIKEGEKLREIYIIRNGHVVMEEKGEIITVLGKGDLIGSVIDIYNDSPSQYNFINKEPLDLYVIERENIMKFLNNYPGLIMKLKYQF